MCVEAMGLAGGVLERGAGRRSCIGVVLQMLLQRSSCRLTPTTTLPHPLQCAPSRAATSGASTWRSPPSPSPTCAASRPPTRYWGGGRGQEAGEQQRSRAAYHANGRWLSCLVCSLSHPCPPLLAMLQPPAPLVPLLPPCCRLAPTRCSRRRITAPPSSTCTSQAPSRVRGRQSTWWLGQQALCQNKLQAPSARHEAAAVPSTITCAERCALCPAPAPLLLPDYDNRVLTHDRAMRAGLDDVGLGTLFGLYDYKYEVRRGAEGWCRAGECRAPVRGLANWGFVLPVGIGLHAATSEPTHTASPSHQAHPPGPHPPNRAGAGHPDARQPPGGRVRRGAAHSVRAPHAPCRRLRRELSLRFIGWRTRLLVGKGQQQQLVLVPLRCTGLASVAASRAERTLLPPWRRCRWRPPTRLMTPPSRSWWPSCASRCPTLA